jgi:MSHA biogenesis protein MshE
VLRTALRQDPDVILVGEMRDKETVEIGLRAAITGHLVLSTLHTNDAPSTAVRLLDMGAPGFLIANALQAVIAQRLIRRLCDRCAAPQPPTEREAAWLSSFAGETGRAGDFRTGRGCNHCNQTGYAGRVGIYELLEMDAALGDALRTGEASVFAAAVRQCAGYRPLAHAALDQARRGLTSLAEVLRVIGSDWHDGG